jgi:hypothetical protein
MKTLFLIFIYLSGLSTVFLSFSLEAQSSFEVPGNLKVGQLVPPSLQSGKYHRVDAQVSNDGLFNTYRLITSFGDYEVTTTTLLKIRVAEVYAIAAMRQIETTDTAVQALKRSGKEAVIGAKNLLTHPLRTLDGAASMVEQLYARTTGTVRRNASDTEGGAFSQLVGLAAVKGEIASQFGVNMYSRNIPLQNELDRLARASFLGGLSVKVATSVASALAPIMGSVLLSTSGTAKLLNDMINTTPPAEMWLQNKRKLMAMKLGFEEDKIEIFLNKTVFSPAMQTVMVASLEGLDGAKNRDLFIELALDVLDARRAKLLTELAVMSLAYHKNISPIREFAPMSKFIFAESTDDALVVLLPADHMIWSKSNASAISFISNRADAGKKRVQLWVLGQVSGKARTELLSRGWNVHTQAGRLLRPAKS